MLSSHFQENGINKRTCLTSAVIIG